MLLIHASLQRGDRLRDFTENNCFNSLREAVETANLSIQVFFASTSLKRGVNRKQPSLNTLFQLWYTGRPS